MFLAEVGVGVVYSLHLPGRMECGDLTKIRSSLLVLHFCKVKPYKCQHKRSAVLSRAINNGT